MSPQFSLITSILLASSTTTTSGAAQFTSLPHASAASITSSGAGSQVTGSVGTISAASTHNRTSSLPVVRAQTTVSLFNACSGPASVCAGIDALTYYGAVITADPSKTIYALDCASGNNEKKNQTQCWSAPLTVTAGPSLFARVNENEGEVPVTVSCDVIDKTKSAVCEQKSTKTGRSGAAATGTVSAQASATAGSGGYGNKTVEVTTLKFNESNIHYNALVITKGANLLSASSSIATKTPLPPTSPQTPGTAPTKQSAALSNRIPLSTSLAGLIAVVVAVFAL